MDERISFENQNGTVMLNRELKWLCNNLEEVANVLKRLGAIPQTMVNQTDYIFQLPSAQFGGNTRRIKFRIVDEKAFGVYLYDRSHNGTEAQFEFIHASDLSLVRALKWSEFPYVMVSKTRTRWILGEILFHLDRVENLGDVVEIESLNGAIVPEEVTLAISPYLFKKLEGSNEDYIEPGDRSGE